MCPKTMPKPPLKSYPKPPQKSHQKSFQNHPEKHPKAPRKRVQNGTRSDGTWPGALNHMPPFPVPHLAAKNGHQNRNLAEALSKIYALKTCVKRMNKMKIEFENGPRIALHKSASRDPTKHPTKAAKPCRKSSHSLAQN